jgi:hypothetical protein
VRIEVCGIMIPGAAIAARSSPTRRGTADRRGGRMGE